MPYIPYSDSPTNHCCLKIVILCFQDVTKIIEDVVELFEKLIVRRPLGVVLENSIEHQLRKISTINFTIPIVSKFVNHIHYTYIYTCACSKNINPNRVGLLDYA